LNDIYQFKSLLKEAIDKTGLSIPSPASTLITRHFELLRKWNSTFNLTSLVKNEDIIDRLYVDSLLFTINIPSKTVKLLDVGSGPGFPGIPMLIAKPYIQLTIAESKSHMCAFLSEVQYALRGEIEFEIVNSRCDSPDFIENYRNNLQIITSKAFAPLKKALEITRPLLKPGGSYITCIGPGTPLEYDKSSGFELQSDVIHHLPITGKPTRHLVLQKKNPD
jgi:16S rRNA (guanine527-N7)-methyltransferase